ncbi:DUF3768 domain-containing protein [Hoeflea sp.]|uniref:DUF3768 domain-containing protein n=1 Tax=Hoeflea sp. TaxID=1940281 RepID=UPI0032EB571A
MHRPDTRPVPITQPEPSEDCLAKPGASTHDLYEADSDFRYGAETPDNPATTVRVLTIMLARDW